MFESYYSWRLLPKISGNYMVASLPELPRRNVGGIPCQTDCDMCSGAIKDETHTFIWSVHTPLIVGRNWIEHHIPAENNFSAIIFSIFVSLDNVLNFAFQPSYRAYAWYGIAAMLIFGTKSKSMFLPLATLLWSPSVTIYGITVLLKDLLNPRILYLGRTQVMDGCRAYVFRFDPGTFYSPLIIDTIILDEMSYLLHQTKQKEELNMFFIPTFVFR